MKMKTTLLRWLLMLSVSVITAPDAGAQQYKIRQVTTMSGMKSETTVYVKGARKRTEGGGYMGMGNNQVTIEQCDLRRTVKINDRKKIYFIQPYEKEEDEEDPKPAKTKPVPVKQETKPEEKPGKGGVITSYYNITDTGERKKIYGFNARHVWTTQKIKPSADACTMKDSMLMKTDGWYIDLAQFNCNTGNGTGSSYNGGRYKPDCKDRFITKRSGKGRLGFPLSETRTMIMGDGRGSATEFIISLETLELSTVKQDSLLFEIPAGYTEVFDEDELQDNAAGDLLKAMTSNGPAAAKPPDEEKKAGITRIGVYAPTGDEQVPAHEVQQYLAGILTSGQVEAVAIGSEEDARTYNCDLYLKTSFTKIKAGSKVGSILKVVKNADPSAASSFHVEGTLTLFVLADHSTRAEQKISGRYDGKLDEAVKKAVEKSGSKLVKELQ